MDCAHNVLVILGGCFRELPVNKYLSNGYNYSRTELVVCPRGVSSVIVEARLIDVDD